MKARERYLKDASFHNEVDVLVEVLIWAVEDELGAIEGYFRREHLRERFTEEALQLVDNGRISL